MGGVPYFGMEGGGAKFWQLWAPHRVAMGGGAEWGGVSWRRGLGGGSLGEFADDADERRVLVLQPLVVGLQVLQCLGGAGGAQGGVNRPPQNPIQKTPSIPPLTFSSSSSSAAFRSSARRSWGGKA